MNPNKKLMYKILWLDDEENKDFQENILNDYNCELVQFSTAEEVLIELENKKIHEYDAILLDVMGVQQSLEEGVTSEGFYKVKERLTQLNYCIQLPVAILTAAPNLSNAEYLEEFKHTVPNTRVFSKFNEESQKQCFEFLSEEIENKIETKIKFKYANQFRFLKEKGFNSDDFVNLLNLLKEIEHGDIKQNKPFTTLRVILDGIFEHLFHAQILKKSEPILYKEQRKILISQNCQQLLAGKVLKDGQYRHIRIKDGKKISPIISNLMRLVYGLGTNDSHNNFEENVKFIIEDKEKCLNYKTLIESSTHNLLLILDYFAHWVKSDALPIEIEERNVSLNYVDTFTRKGSVFLSSWGKDFYAKFGCYYGLHSRYSKEGDSFKTEVKAIPNHDSSLRKYNYTTSEDINDYKRV